MDPDVQAIADNLRPRQFEFRNVAPNELPAAMMDADYLCGFIGPIETDVIVAAAARRLKLVQLMSAGYDRFNIEGARAALTASDMRNSCSSSTYCTRNSASTSGASRSGSY